MTYAATQVSYWVGQANDTSTATHPTGWVTGQRWSVTASQWQTMQGTEFANARDTSVSTHPTGWVSGQLWSVTASQWQSMYNAEVTLYNTMTTDRNTWQTNANNAWGSSRVYNSGTSWETAYNNEVALYNGMVTDRNNWQTNANNAWGPDRVYNSGSSWEALYNTAQNNYLAYVNYYNDMVSQRDTWASRANQAWGPSRVWASGAAFETLYNNQTTAYNTLLNGLNSPEGLQSQGFAISHNAGGSQAHYGDFAFARTGHFFVAVLLPIHAPSISQNNSQSNLILGGTAGITLNQNFNAGPTGAHDILHGGVWDVNVAAGATITIDYMAFVTGNPTTGTCTIYAHFVPNATYHN